jgi:hypothetical protein
MHDAAGLLVKRTSMKQSPFQQLKTLFSSFKKLLDAMPLPAMHD